MRRFGLLVLACLALAGGAGLRPALALTGGEQAPAPGQVVLDSEQASIFRAWMLRIIQEQVRQGPSPRWMQRDCASLVRFAVAESLRPHDRRWLRANGLSAEQLPAELRLTTEQQALRHAWRLHGGASSAYVSAIELVQENSRFVSKDVNQAQPGDLLFFDQGDDQHLMVWMNGMVAYHTGTSTRDDNGLRAVPVSQLLHWKDTRWRPTQDNPNFAGIYRLAFLPY